MNIQTLIQEFQTKYNYTIIYITQYGSKLYGTDNPNSDTDYKGLFIPSAKDVLLKRDIDHYNFSSGDDKSKNSQDDIDLQLFSIYKFFHLLKKGETGAMDILFSLFREDTQIYNDPQYTLVLKEYYPRFYNRKLHSFIGYCVGQSKLYNIKGERYNELTQFTKALEEISKERFSHKLESLYSDIEELIVSHRYKYIDFVMAPTSRGSGEHQDGRYIEVLGKRFLGTVTIAYFIEKITDMQAQFGNRAKASAKGVDYKALSHAMRVISEIEELLDDNFITFPLKNAHYIKQIKEGKITLEEVMNVIDQKLDIVNAKLEASDLPLNSDEEFMDGLILEWVR